MKLHKAPLKCRIKSRYYQSPSSLLNWCLIGQKNKGDVCCGNCENNIPAIIANGFQEGLMKSLECVKKNGTIPQQLEANEKKEGAKNENNQRNSKSCLGSPSA